MTISLNTVIQTLLITGIVWLIWAIMIIWANFSLIQYQKTNEAQHPHLTQTWLNILKAIFEMTGILIVMNLIIDGLMFVFA